jgi:UDP-3-O-[3-hydroxymyristoyl] glucosamine N-acyltransferase
VAATLGQLAAEFGCELDGDPSIVVNRVGTLANAAPDAVTFLANSLYRSQLADTRAAAVILAPRDRGACPVASLVHPEPYLTYARIASSLHPPLAVRAGVHATAVVAADARVAPTAQVDAHAVIGGGCTIDDGVVVGAGTVLGANVQVGRGTRLAPRVTLLDGVRIGARCIVHPGVVIGADGFGFASDRGAWQKIPQVGGVVIGNDVEIGANTTIDRGAIEDTVIEDGVKLDNLVQIGHNVRVGAHTAMAGCVGVAGSTRIGAHCTIGGGAGVLGHLVLADHVHVSAMTTITRSIHQPGQYSGVFPFDDNAAWEKNAATLRQLHALRDRLRALEKKS